MEESSQRLKRMLSHSGGLSLLRGRLEVQVVIAWRQMVGMRQKGQKMGKGPWVYKGRQAIEEDSF